MIKNKQNRRHLSAICIALIFGWANAAFAGPPYVTDDPAPTDSGHWEIYNFAMGSHVPGATLGAAGLDLNYGAAENLQLTAVFPLQFQNQGQLGLGDIELAAKYRFFHQDENSPLPDVAFFPRLFAPTAGRSFGTGRPDLLLPVWAGKDWGKWSLFGGGGYTINPGAGNRDYWLGGIVLSREVTESFTLGLEIYHQTRIATDGRDFTGFNVGATYQMTEHWSLLLSGGPGIQNPRQEGEYAFYTALKADY